MLGSVPSDGTVIVADLEAGIGTLTRLAEEAVDVTVVVVEPTPRSIDVGQRAVSVAEEKKQGRIVVVANKVGDTDDRSRVQAAFEGKDFVVIPDDPVVDKADRSGLSPLDVDGTSPAVTAVVDLAALLVP